MKIVQDPLPRIVFSDQERETLYAAAKIADDARELWGSAVDYSVEAEDMDTELAMVGISARTVVDGINI